MDFIWISVSFNAGKEYFALIKNVVCFRNAVPRFSYHVLLSHHPQWCNLYLFFCAICSCDI